MANVRFLTGDESSTDFCPSKVESAARKLDSETIQKAGLSQTEIFQEITREYRFKG